MGEIKGEYMGNGKYMEHMMKSIDYDRQKTIIDFKIEDNNLRVYFGKGFDMVKYQLPMKVASESELNKLKAMFEDILKRRVERDSKQEAMLSKVKEK